MDKEVDSAGAASYAHFHDAAFDDCLFDEKLTNRRGVS